LFGDNIAFRDWTAPGDLQGFDIVLPLIAWGYPRNIGEWYGLLDRLEAETLPVANPVSVLRWNSDKTYLTELAALGVATLPTRLSLSLSDADVIAARAAFACERLVIKPPVSAGADGTFLLEASDTVPQSVAGKRMLIQPYLSAIASEGELSLFTFGGTLSHAISKHPAKGDFRVQEQFGGTERTIEACPEARALAAAALSATQQVTNCGTLAYARIDILRDDAGAFRLMELELIEPSLFLGHAADKGAAFAKAIDALQKQF
jgi:glutathione synthase/RimK-type ligase-like ATP-grasp enzyme